MPQHQRTNRWQVKWQAKIRIEGSASPVDCFIEDINFKGFKIDLGFKLPALTAFRVWLAFTQDCFIEAEVWVAWSKRFGGMYQHGVFFNKISDADKDKIYQFIRKYHPGEMTRVWFAKNEDKERGEAMQDRRVFQRFGMDVAVSLLNSYSGEEDSAQTVDVSAKGIGLVTEAQVAQGAPLELWLRLPDRREPLYTRGTVAWSKPFGLNRYRVGVSLDNADLMGISRLMRAM